VGIDRQLRSRLKGPSPPNERLRGSPKLLPAPTAEALPNSPVVEKAAPPPPASPPPSPRWAPPSHWLRSGQPPEPWRPFVQATDVTHHLFMDLRRRLLSASARDLINALHNANGRGKEYFPPRGA
jgi:hypothetical protein